MDMPREMADEKSTRQVRTARLVVCDRHDDRKRLSGSVRSPDHSVPPGGVTDTAARLIGQQLSTKWGQSVVIENRPGTGGVIGVEAAARSAPDGYTLLMAINGEITINAAISAKPKYDVQKDLARSLSRLLWRRLLS